MAGREKRITDSYSLFTKCQLRVMRRWTTMNCRRRGNTNTSRSDSAMKPTNVLFILSDEHQHNLMGCAGHPLIKTPALDALAQRGTRFSNAYTPSPICVPARASLA